MSNDRVWYFADDQQFGEAVAWISEALSNGEIPAASYGMDEQGQYIAGPASLGPEVERRGGEALDRTPQGEGE
jgi:hypothetical protein